ncbi:Glycoside hydrolase [Trema orientale]|uniref:non-reducing end alpha-L-arabinofuranosidase n=1 Tax=Trema orientale TaxID=63057 RepID=A0A2P5EW70_TREOI|nr:Glycoside hydrolase [Trema orientale]
MKLLWLKLLCSLQRNYRKFYNAIKSAYPDIKIITNCDGSSQKLDHPSDLYDYHVYTSSSDIFSRGRHFDSASRNGPKAFVSEYAVTGNDAGKGSFLAALGEAGFLIGLEKNRCVIAFKNLFLRSDGTPMQSSSTPQMRTPSYWVQRFFTESSGATLHKTTLQTNSSSSIIASAISWKSSDDDKTYLRIKIVNYGSDTVNIKISVDGLDPNSVKLSGATKTVLTSSNLMDENSFNEPNKVVPTQSLLETTGNDIDATLPPRSLTSFDLLKETSSITIAGTDPFSRSSM